MSKKRLVLFGVLFVLVSLVLSSALVAGQGVGDKLSRAIRVKLGLDSDIYRVIETEYQGEKLILIAIYGNEKAQASSLGSKLKSGLKRYRDQTPVAIAVLSRDKDVKFHPYGLRVIQEGEKSPARQIIGITTDFKEGALPTKVPIQGEEFWGSKGIITLGEGFDTSSPFEIKYGTRSAKFSSVSGGDEGLTPVTEESQEGQKTEGPGFKTSEETGGSTEIETRPKESTPPSGPTNKGAGEGFALLAQFGALLAITLSFL